MRCKLVLVGLAALGATGAFAQTLLDTDFESGIPSQFSGAGALESVQGFSGLGNGVQFGGSFLRNDAQGVQSEFIFNGLGAHTSISIGFLLGVIDSWDSTNGSVAPDLFGVRVDGVEIFTTTFNNTTGSVNYQGDDIGGGYQHRGWNGGWTDQAFDMYSESMLQNIAHTNSTLVVSFVGYGSGYQGGTDESWGIDNLKITANAVPEPSTLAALAVFGLLGRRVARRKR